jgi:lysophospholipase L1-like esterase
MKQLFTLFTTNLLILISLVSLLELSSRYFLAPVDNASIFDDQSLRTRGRSFVETHAIRGFALKPNFSNDLYRINSQGFRGDEFPDNLQTDYKTLLAMGESTTFGWDVKNQQTYPVALMQLFTHQQHYVINAGIPSYTSSQTLLYLKEILSTTRIKPDVILINIMWNDIWYSSIKNWHPDILVYQQPPTWLTWLTKNSRLVHWAIMGKKTQEGLIDIENRAALNQYKKNLQTMVLLGQKHKATVVFIEPPFDLDHMPKEGLNEFHVRYSKQFFLQQAKKYRQIMHQVAQEQNIHVINHSLSLDALHQNKLFLDLLHPTAEGNAIMARDIYHALQKKM